MIISENNKPSLACFQSLMCNVDARLNADALQRENYYTKRNGKLLEEDVFKVTEYCAIGTPFENSIQLISGASFPDIVAHKYYGIEVKSTKQNFWKSIGSSILESTRIKDVERIYITFGKLGKPVKFYSRLYQECLYGIAVTHYPRYQIDMKLQHGETIFDKMGIPYDELRKMDNPVKPVSQYYKSLLKEGESLWWADSETESTAPATIKLWSALNSAEKITCTIHGMIRFPELFKATSNTKYNRYTLWLVKRLGVVNNNARDSFSAGGKGCFVINNSQVVTPAVFRRVFEYKEEISDILSSINDEELKEYWGVDYIEKNRVKQWARIIASEAASSFGYDDSLAFLKYVFDF